MKSKWQYVWVSALLASTLIAPAASSQAMSPPRPSTHSEHSTTAVHGMVLFGNQQLYISHLGLYYPPHDRQIVAAVSMSNLEDQRRFKKLRAGYAGLITLAPKAFPLENLAPDADAFQTQIVADVYTGHFERGGKKVLSDVAITVQKPIIYQALNAQQPTARNAQFWQLGQGDNAYLIYQIGAAPDQDYIAKISSELKCETLCELNYSAREKGPELRFSTQQAQIFEANGSDISIAVERNIYYETQDFKQ